MPQTLVQWHDKDHTLSTPVRNCQPSEIGKTNHQVVWKSMTYVTTVSRESKLSLIVNLFQSNSMLLRWDTELA